jgi:hypothetical protein
MFALYACMVFFAMTAQVDASSLRNVKHEQSRMLSSRALKAKSSKEPKALKSNKASKSSKAPKARAL